LDGVDSESRILLAGIYTFRMRILLVNQYFPPDTSATAYLIGELAEDLSTVHEVWVLAGTPSYNPEGSQFRPLGVRVERARSTRFQRASMAGRLLNYATFLTSATLRGVQLPRPDVILAFTDPPVVSLIGLTLAKRYGVPFVHACLDLFPDIAIALRRMDNPIIVRGWRAANQIVRREASRIVAVGRDMKERLEQQGVPEAKLAFIPNWAQRVDISQQDVAAVRSELGWSGRFVIMHAGNLGLAQNLMSIVRAAIRLRHRTDFLWVFLGDGAAKRGLQDAVTGASLPRAEAQPVLAAADLHIISLAQGLRGCAVPSKVYGVMALGLPFIGAVEPRSEVDLILDETGAGLRVDPGDDASLADSVVGLADRWPDLRELGRRGRKVFDERYERHKATARYAQLLESLGPPTGEPN
jgi:colanic acid biosynthesis glycosyl transferase WcaI